MFIMHQLILHVRFTFSPSTIIGNVSSNKHLGEKSYGQFSLHTSAVFNQFLFKTNNIKHIQQKKAHFS